MLKKNVIKIAKVTGIVSICVVPLVLAIISGSPDPENETAGIPLTAKSEKYAHCNDSVPFGFPQFKYNKGDYFLCHNFVMEYNPLTTLSVWVAEHVLGNNLKKYKDQEMLYARFRNDPRIPKEGVEQPKINDYKELSKIYQGTKLASIENWKHSDLAQSQTYYFTNLFPLYKGNEKIYKDIERYFRYLTEKYGESYIFSGSVFYPVNGESYIKQSVRLESLKVPTYFFKMIYLPKRGVVAFAVPNSYTQSKNILSYSIKLPNLEAMTNIRFFPLAKVKIEDLNPREL